MKKNKLDLKELELQLPSIDSDETKIIIGGDSYGHHAAGSFDMWYWGGNGNSSDHDDDDGRSQGQDADQGDLDHYFDNYDGHQLSGDWGYDDGPTSTTGGSASIVYDGLNVASYDNLTINTGNVLFDNAIREIFSSNSQIAGLVSSLLSDKSNHIQFAIADLGPNVPGSTVTIADTNTADYSNYTITFNSNAFVDGKFILDGTGLDNAGVDNTSLDALQEFVGMVAHELLHVKYLEQFQAATSIPGANFDAMANYMTSHYGADFRDIFMIKVGDHYQVRDFSDPLQKEAYDQLVHDYMKAHDLDFINNVIKEYTSERGTVKIF